jgi:hypothetical protein
MPYADYAEHLERNRARQKTPRGAENHLRANQAYRLRNRLKRRAHNLIAKAVARGKIQAWPACAMPECSETKVHGHHADYESPLSVTWLCDPHHKQTHAMAKG